MELFFIIGLSALIVLSAAGLSIARNGAKMFFAIVAIIFIAALAIVLLFGQLQLFFS